MKQASISLCKKAIYVLLALILVIGLMPAFPAKAMADERTDAGTGSGGAVEADIDAMLAAGDYVEGEAIAIVRADLEPTANDGALSASLSAESILDSGTVMTTASTEIVEEAFDVELPSAEAAANDASLAAIDVAEDDAVEVVFITGTGLSTRELLEALFADERVIVAEPNYITQLSALDNEEGSDADEAIIEANNQVASEINAAETASDTVGSENTSESTATLSGAGDIAVTKEEGGLEKTTGGAYDFSSWEWGYDKSYTSGKAFKRLNDTSSTDGTMGITGWNDSSKKNAAGTVVAVFDTGVDYENTDLASVMISGDNSTIAQQCGGSQYGYNASCDGKAETDCQDYNGHGSHCAGIIAAAWNEYGTSGAANGTQILALRGFPANGGLDSQAKIKGYDYLCECVKAGMNIVAVNNSWGSDLTGTYTQSLLVTKLGKLGTISVFSAGNSDYDNDVHYATVTTLAENPYAVVVNAARHTLANAAYSSYGQMTCNVYGYGSEVVSTVGAHTDEAWHVYGPADTDPLYRNYFTSDSTLKQNIWVSQCDGTTVPTKASDLGDWATNATFSKDASVDAAAGSGSLAITANGDYWVAVPVATSDTSNIQTITVQGYAAKRDTMSGASLQLVGYNAAAEEKYTYLNAGGKTSGYDEWLTAEGLRTSNLADGYSLYTITDGAPSDTTLLLLKLTVSNLAADDSFYLDCLTVHGTTDAGSSARSWTLMEGTSMATPSVAGCAAIVAAQKVPASTSQTAGETAIARANYLKAHVVQSSDFTNKCTQGGMVNLEVADADATPVVNKAVQNADGTVTLTGAYFGTTQGTVQIGSKDATVTSWSDTSITATVDSSVASGEQLVIVTGSNGKAGRFKVLYQSNIANDVQAFEDTLQSPDSSDAIANSALVGVAAGSYEPSASLRSAAFAEANGQLFLASLDAKNGTGSYNGLFRYDIDSNSWTAPIVFDKETFGFTKLAYCSIASYNGLVYIFGFDVTDVTNPCFRFVSYDPQNDNVVQYNASGWYSAESAKFLNATLTAADDGLMLVGGSSVGSGTSTGNIATVTLGTESDNPTVSYDVVGTVTPESGKTDVINPQVVVRNGTLYIGSFATVNTTSNKFVLDASLYKLTKGSDGKWGNQTTVTTPTILSTSSLDTTSGYLPMYALASTYDGIVMSGANVDAGSGVRSAHDTYILKDDAAEFTAYGRSASLGTLYYPVSIVTGNYLYTLGSTKYSEGGDAGAMVFRRTAIDVCTVSFDMNDHGTAPDAQKVVKGETATAPADPTADGYAFAGWYKEASCTNAFDFSTPITADTTLYASWKTLAIEAPDGSAGATANKDDLAAVGTAQAKVNPNAQSIVVKLDVAQGADSAADEALVRAAAGSKQVVMYGVHLGSQIDGGELTDIGSSNDVLVRVTYALDQSKATGIQTLRVHNGALDELTSTPNADGEYVSYDASAGTVTVAAKKYSTYAFAYTPATDNGSTVTTAKTGDQTGMLAASLAAIAALAAAAGACAFASRRRRGSDR